MASTIRRPTGARFSWEPPTKHPPSLSPVSANGGSRKAASVTRNPATSSSWPTPAAAMAQTAWRPAARDSASTVRCPGPVRHSFSLPFRGLQMESHRASFVQPDQQELGSRTSGPLRKGPQVHPHHHDHYRIESECTARYHLLPNWRQAVKGRTQSTLHSTKTRSAKMELHHLAPNVKLFLGGCLAASHLSGSTIRSGRIATRGRAMPV